MLGKLIKNTSVLLLADVVSSVFLFGEMLVLARYLGAEKFGVYVIIVSYVQTVYHLFDVRLWEFIFHYISKYLAVNDEGRALATIRVSYLFTLMTGVLAGMAAIVLSGFAAGILGKLYLSDYTLLACLPLLFKTTEAISNAILRYFEKFGWLLVCVIGKSMLEFALVTTMLILDPEIGLAAIFGLRAFTSGIGMLLFGFAVFKTVSCRFRSLEFSSWSLLKDTTREKLTFVFHTHLTSLWRISVVTVDILIVSRFSGEIGAAVYKIAKSFLLVIQKLYDPLYNSVFPSLVKKYHKLSSVEIKKYLASISKFMAAIFFPYGVALFVLSDWMIPFFAGKEMVDAVPLFRIMLVGVVNSCILVWTRPMIIAIGKPHLGNIISAVGAVTAMCFIFLAVPRVGPIAAAIAILLNYIIGQALYLFFLRKSIWKVR